MSRARAGGRAGASENSLTQQLGSHLRTLQAGAPRAQPTWDASILAASTRAEDHGDPGYRPRGPTKHHPLWTASGGLRAACDCCSQSNASPELPLARPAPAEGEGGINKDGPYHGSCKARPENPQVGKHPGNNWLQKPPARVRPLLEG